MTKVELIAKVAAEADLSKKDAEKAVAAVIDGITAALKAGDKVSLVGFGTFETRERPARTGLNPVSYTHLQAAAVPCGAPLYENQTFSVYEAPSALLLP